MAEISPLRQMIEDMTVRNLSPATQQSYLSAVSRFSRYFGRSPDRLGLEDVHAFQVHLVATGISWPALNQIVCALRFFYGVTLARQGRQGPLRHAVSAAPEDSTHVLAVHSAEAMVVSWSRRRASACTQRLACRLPFSPHGGELEKASDGAHAAPHIRDPSSGERGGRAHHPGPARSCQPLKHGALHPGRNQDDQQHAEPTRSAPLGSGATRLSRFHGTGAGNGGHFPLPWRSVSTGARWSPRVRRASHHGRHHGLPHGRARWPCRAMR